MPSVENAKVLGNFTNMEKRDSRVLGVLHEEEENSGASSLEDGEDYDEVDAGLCNRSKLRQKNLQSYNEMQLAKKDTPKKKKRSDSAPNVGTSMGRGLLKIFLPGTREGKKRRSNSQPAIQTQWHVTGEGVDSKEKESDMKRVASDVVLHDADTDPVKFDISLEDDESIDVHL